MAFPWSEKRHNNKGQRSQFQLLQNKKVQQQIHPKGKFTGFCGPFRNLVLGAIDTIEETKVWNAFPER